MKQGQNATIYSAANLIFPWRHEDRKTGSRLCFRDFIWNVDIL